MKKNSPISLGSSGSAYCCDWEARVWGFSAVGAQG